MSGRALLVLCAMLAIGGCTRQQPVAPREEAQRLPPPPSPSPGEAELRARALALGAGDCGDLKRIEYLVPKAGQLGNDVYYDRIYVHPAEYRSCLIESVSDATPIPAVHGGPGLQITTVGDMAYLMLGDMHAIPPNDCVPQDIKKKMERQGVVAFDQWRRDSTNRRRWAECIQRHFARKT